MPQSSSESWRFQSMTIDINQYQSISINRLILIIDDQSMAKISADYRLVFRSSISMDWKRRGKWVIRVPEPRDILSALRRLDRNCFTNFVLRASLKWRMIGQVACVTSVLGCCQSIALDELFLCGYRLIID